MRSLSYLFIDLRTNTHTHTQVQASGERKTKNEANWSESKRQIYDAAYKHGEWSVGIIYASQFEHNLHRPVMECQVA
jgi:hypothetical protein